MNVFVEEVIGPESLRNIQQIEQEVFEQELHIQLTSGGMAEPRFQLVARAGSSGEALGSLAVVDTTADLTLRRKCGIEIETGKKIARYTRLAVRRPFRGLDIPLFLILEANRRFILPNAYDYSWLLFEEKKAKSISLTKVFNMIPLEIAVQSEYGLSRALLRDEHSASARAGNLRAARLLANKTGICFRPSPNVIECICGFRELNDSPVEGHSRMEAATRPMTFAPATS